MLAATLREAVRRFGDSPAYITADSWSLDYAALDRLSDEVAVGWRVGVSAWAMSSH